MRKYSAQRFDTDDFGSLPERTAEINEILEVAYAHLSTVELTLEWLNREVPELRGEKPYELIFQTMHPN